MNINLHNLNKSFTFYKNIQKKYKNNNNDVEITVCVSSSSMNKIEFRFVRKLQLQSKSIKNLQKYQSFNEFIGKCVLSYRWHVPALLV